MANAWSTIMLWAEYALLIMVVALMIWRRLYREFPFLFAYFTVVVAAAIARQVAIFRFSTHSMPYFYAYWLSEALIVIASFAVLYEVFLVRMFPSFHTTPFLRYLLPLVILIGAVVGVIIFLTAPVPAHGPHPLSVLVGKTTLALNFLQVVLLLLFSLVLATLGGGWEEHEFGIALGYGLYAISQLVTTAVRAKSGYASTAVDQLPALGYFAALVVWIIYLSREYRPPDVDIPVELVALAQSWEKLLRDLVGRRRR